MCKIANHVARWRRSFLGWYEFAAKYQYLYRFAENREERASVLRFCIRLFGSHLPGNSYQRDAVICLHGVKYVVGQSAEVFTLIELHRDHFYDMIEEFVPTSGWTVLDVGANVGMFTIQQALRGARVFAFEPNPDCFRRLSRSIDANGVSHRVSPFQYAVGRASSSGMMHLPKGWTTHGSVTIPHEPTAFPTDAAAAVDIVSLDEIVPSLKITRVDLLKIDVEGAEVDVLSGARQTLGIVQRVIIEYHSQDLLERITKILRDCGFSPMLQAEVLPEINGGLLYAEVTEPAK